MFSKIKKIAGINPVKFVKWNYCSRNVIRDKGQYLIPRWHAVIDISKSAKLVLHTSFYVNDPKYKHAKEEAFLVIGDHAEMEVNGVVHLGSGSTIQVNNNAIFNVGASYINHDASIVIGYNTTIGNGNLIGRGVKIIDSDYHKVLDHEGNQTNTPKEMVIGNHVWIGLGSVVLRGSQIGDGAVISAGSVVMGKIKEGTVAMGNPARSFSKIQWEE